MQILCALARQQGDAGRRAELDLAVQIGFGYGHNPGLAAQGVRRAGLGHEIVNPLGLKALKVGNAERGGAVNAVHLGSDCGQRVGVEQALKHDIAVPSESGHVCGNGLTLVRAGQALAPLGVSNLDVKRVAALAGARLVHGATPGAGQGKAGPAYCCLLLLTSWRRRSSRPSCLGPRPCGRRSDGSHRCSCRPGDAETRPRSCNSPACSPGCGWSCRGT